MNKNEKECFYIYSLDRPHAMQIFAKIFFKRTCRTTASTTHVVRNACVTIVRISCHNYCCV